MKIIIVRHGDPDYEHDSLTDKGRKEASLAAEKLSGLDIKSFYVSPLGRAKATAQYTLDKMNRTAETHDWLRESHAPVIDETTGEEHLPWDFIPSVWTNKAEFYDKYKWFTEKMMSGGNVIKEAERVWNGLDEILKNHGYERDNNCYKAVKPNRDTIVFFCHFGVECVMLSHLLGIAPTVLWHAFCALPTSMTTLISEERREGTAFFRMNAFGDTGHLYAAGEEPSFSARFCETFDSDERHD